MPAPDSVETAAPWQLWLLTGPRLSGPEGAVRLDRRSTLLLAYLALEGPQQRSRLSALLFPEVSDQTGRANLRQLIRRTNEATRGEVLEGTDPLSVRSTLRCDIQVMRELAAAGATRELTETVGRLQAELDLDGVHDELRRWLQDLGEWADRQRVDACHTLAAELEGVDERDAAIEQHRRALWFDPVNELSYRALMRLHYLAGDRAAAMAAYSRCRVALHESLGVAPDTATTALADEIGRARVRRDGAPAGALPVAVQRPPQLIGREREWDAMEAAFRAGKGVILTGPPGIGKTRLMQEFLASHGRPLYFRGRPDDRAVPYGTHARTYRELVDAIGGGDVLPAWARHELSRIVPQLGETPLPLSDDAGRLRFWAAKIEAHRIAHAQGFDALGFDDLQYVDPASATAGAYVLQQLNAESPTPIRTIHTYRLGELPPDMLASLHEWASAGLVVHLELEPLTPDAVDELVRSLGIPHLATLAPQLREWGAGVPLFVLETAKHVLETGGALPDERRLHGRTREVLGARLRRLSPPALLVARTLATCPAQFSLELASAVTDTPLAQVLDAWSELVEARIVRDSAFTHDLLSEAVVADMEGAVSAMLHRRVARYLELARAGAGHVGPHWLAAGEQHLAAAASRAAVSDARYVMLPDEAAVYFGSRSEVASPH